MKAAIAKVKELENEIREQAYEIMIFKADIRQYKWKNKSISLGAIVRDDVLLETSNARLEDGVIYKGDIMSDCGDHEYRNTCMHLNHW